MKFRAHDTFAIRKGWLHKGMRHILKNPRLFVAKDINAMDELGIGSNMVKALRYWLKAFGLTEEVGTTSKQQVFTELGKLIWENDEFMEEDGTYCILHYMLASNKELATAWYYFFNIYNMTEITKESFINDIKLSQQIHYGNLKNVINEHGECLLSAEPYPLVLDAPFSYFDEYRTSVVSPKLSNLTEQIIIFSKDPECGIIMKYAQDKIGKLYTLQFETQEEDEKEVVWSTHIVEGGTNAN